MAKIRTHGKQEKAEKGSVVVTKKIEIRIVESDAEKKKEQYKLLWDYRYKVFKMANMIVGNQYFNMLYAQRIKHENQIEKIGDAIKKASEEFGTSVQNSTYQLITKAYPEVPSAIKSSLNSTVFKNFNEDIPGMLKGEKSVRTYTLGLPIPFNLSGVTLTKEIVENDKKKKEEKYYLNWLNGIKFNLNFGRDRSNNQIIVDRILAEEYKFCDSNIYIDKKDNKVYLLLCVKFPKQIVKLDYNKFAATNLGMICPIYLTTNVNGLKKQIGSAEDFLQVRLQMQERHSKLSSALKTARAGHGRGRKLKTLDNLKAIEKNFARTYNHKLSKEIVQFCVKNGIGNIITEDLLGGANTLNPSFILRNWSYYQLQEMIEDKAGRLHIKVHKLDPEFITQTCNCCKNVSKKAVDLMQRLYICDNKKCAKFGKGVDIDYNASLNLLETPLDKKKVQKKKPVEV